jgi:beta-N-acetylhexosaminidase
VPTTELSGLAGSLIVGGFQGHAVDRDTARALADGRRAGVILFRRNVESVEAVWSLVGDVIRETASGLSPLVAVDQEGGSVRRLGSPAVELPPMRVLGKIGDADLVRRAGALVGRQLAAIGFNVDFAPVLDVDSNPQNPVIGDRAFDRDPSRVAALAVPFGEGLQSAGVLACGKHFPGHGDTDEDSHLDLPVVRHSVERLRSVELVPFRAAAELGSIMTAHVVYEALDPGVPATLSSKIVTGILRRELGFPGVAFSDDLEMRALADRHAIEESSVRAIRAGCDALLVCSSFELAERAHGALVREAERDSTFRARLEEARARVDAVRRRFPVARAPSLEALSARVNVAEGAALLHLIERRS